MTEKKLTYADALTVAINAVENGEVKEKLEALKASISKKNGAERKPTANQKHNAELADVLYDFLCDHSGEGMTVSEICKKFDVFVNEEISTSKATAILAILVKAGKVENYKDKRRSLYRIVEG